MTFQLSTRIYNRLWSVPSFQKPLQQAGQLWRDVLFRLNVSYRESGRIKLGSCQNLIDYYEFSCDYFGPHQNRSEILELLEFARKISPKNVCEIGTAAGGTNFLLSQALPTVCLMVGIDLFVTDKRRLSYFSRPSVQHIYLDGSSYASETVKRAQRAFSGRSLDVLFIDGDHSYNGVRQDFLSYRQFVRDGGLIVFHDIVPDYMARYGRNTGRWAGGVPQFWQKLKAFYPHKEFIENPEQDGLGIGVLTYIPGIDLGAKV